MGKIGGKAVEEGGSRIRSVLATGGMEAAQETTAAVLQNWNEQGYNAEKELFDAGLIDDAIAGGGAGAIVQAVTDFFIKGRSVDRSAEAKILEAGDEELEVAAREREVSALENEAYDAVARGDDVTFEQAVAESAQPDMFTRELEEAREANPEAALRAQLEAREDRESTTQPEPSDEPVAVSYIAQDAQPDLPGMFTYEQADKLKLEERALEAAGRTREDADAELAAVQDISDLYPEASVSIDDLSSQQISDLSALSGTEVGGYRAADRGDKTTELGQIQGLIDRLDKMELDDQDLATIEAEINALDVVAADMADMIIPSKQESLDLQQTSDRANTTEAKRYATLQDTIENNPTNNYKTLQRKFEQQLKKRGLLVHRILLCKERGTIKYSNSTISH